MQKTILFYFETSKSKTGGSVAEWLACWTQSMGYFLPLPLNQKRNFNTQRNNEGDSVVTLKATDG